MDILCNNINCDGIGMRRADWDNFRECERIMLNGQQIWGYPLSDAVKSQIYEDIVTTGHHSASLAAEVWRAANLYCQSHAASHPELTAQGKLLSAFVNADKDMYCSLPLDLTPEAQSALPTRGIVGDGNVYIQLGIKTKTTTSIRTKVKALRQNGTYMHIFGGQSSATSNNSLQCLRHNSNYFWCAISNGEVHTSKTMTIGQYYLIECNHTTFKVDGVTLNTSTTATADCNIPMFLFWNNRNGNGVDSKFAGSIPFFEALDCQDGNHYFVPNKDTNNVVQWLDLETLTLATRVGTFTEQKTIPNS